MKDDVAIKKRKKVELAFKPEEIIPELEEFLDRWMEEASKPMKCPHCGIEPLNGDLIKVNLEVDMSTAVSKEDRIKKLERKLKSAQLFAEQAYEAMKRVGEYVAWIKQGDVDESIDEYPDEDFKL